MTSTFSVGDAIVLAMMVVSAGGVVGGLFLAPWLCERRERREAQDAAGEAHYFGAIRGTPWQADTASVAFRTPDAGPQEYRALATEAAEKAQRMDAQRMARINGGAA